MTTLLGRDIFIVTLAAVGMVVGYVLSRSSHSGWRPLDSLPGAAPRVLAATRDTVSMCGEAESFAEAQSPKAIRESINCTTQVEQSRIHITYALLGDGSVWRWATPVWPDSASGPVSLGV